MAPPAGPPAGGRVPEDVAGVASFVASPDAAWLTGQVITLDGGPTPAGQLG